MSYNICPSAADLVQHPKARLCYKEGSFPSYRAKWQSIVCVYIYIHCSFFVPLSIKRHFCHFPTGTFVNIASVTLESRWSSRCLGNSFGYKRVVRVFESNDSFIFRFNFFCRNLCSVYFFFFSLSFFSVSCGTCHSRQLESTSTAS